MCALQALCVGGGGVTSERVQLDGEARIPGRVVSALGGLQAAYRAYLDHSQSCVACAPRGARCEVATMLWTTYRGLRR
jgi:hypothetical protein